MKRDMNGHLSSGRISLPDRIQRSVAGIYLMGLTLWRLTEVVDWRSIVAVVIQMELITTGLLGWCPVYWWCRRNPTTKKIVSRSRK